MTPIRRTLCCALVALSACATAPRETVPETPMEMALKLQIPAATPDGPYRALYEDQTLKGTGPVQNARKQGAWKFYARGSAGKTLLIEGSFAADVPDGEWKEYYPSGKMRSLTEYKGGKIHGKRTRFYESGIGMSEEYYQNGLKQRKCLEFYENGNTKENSMWRNGQRNGATTTFYPTGKMKEMGVYLDGVPHGNWDLYDENGRIRSRGAYKAGKKTGVWQIYDEKGAKIKEEKYD